MQTLQPNSILQGGKYKILSVLGQGGFGITYLAEQTMLGRNVAIKEFFMKGLSDRDENTSHVTLGTAASRDTVIRFREKFLREARNIARLNHPNIVRIFDVFEENGTAYYVMDYIGGGSLSANVKQYGALSEPLATRYILQVADALEYVHSRSMNHLDVKPANIVLNDENDAAILIDFGLAKQYDSAGEQTSTTPVGISDGYAPLEQYRPGGVGTFSPQTDIYSLGATFFYLLTGQTPPSASDVNEDGVPVEQLQAKGVSHRVIDVICNSMKSSRRLRLQDVGAFKEMLNSNVSAQVKANTKDNEFEDTLIVTSIDNQSNTSDSEKEKKTESFTVNSVLFTMVRVEGGTFTMGASSEEGSIALDDEKPAHLVTLSTYYIGETVVTQELWENVMWFNPSYFKGTKLPVTLVSWNDCQNFIKKLNRLTGKTFRLPTEAEWEYAARGGRNSKRYKYCGSNSLGDVAWYNNNSGRSSHEVGRKEANELGLYDMSGNVREWCNDWYRDNYYANSPKQDPSGPNIGVMRVTRGGCMLDDTEHCRASYRGFSVPDRKENYIGFRLALSE